MGLNHGEKIKVKYSIGIWKYDEMKMILRICGGMIMGRARRERDKQKLGNNILKRKGRSRGGKMVCCLLELQISLQRGPSGLGRGNQHYQQLHSIFPFCCCLSFCISLLFSVSF